MVALRGWPLPGGPGAAPGRLRSGGPPHGRRTGAHPCLSGEIVAPERHRGDRSRSGPTLSAGAPVTTGRPPRRTSSGPLPVRATSRRSTPSSPGAGRARGSSRGESGWREKRAALPRRDVLGAAGAGIRRPGRGGARAGLAPAAHGANRTGRVFTGDASGDFLWPALHRPGSRTSPSRRRGRRPGAHRPPGHRTGAMRPAGQQATPQERDTCAPYLVRELALCAAGSSWCSAGSGGRRRCATLADRGSQCRAPAAVRPRRGGALGPTGHCCSAATT